MEIPVFPFEEDKTAGDKARRRYLAKYACSEATILGLRDQGIIHCTDDLVRTATGFSGGVGGCHQEICGALSAGVMALGFIYGRSVFRAEISPCNTRVKEMLRRFKESRGSNLCKDLTEGFDPNDREIFYGRERIMRCAEIVRYVGDLVAELTFWNPSPAD